MLVYSTANTPAGERAFRYIAVRSSQRIPILPTVLVGDKKLVGETDHVGLSCSDLCRIVADPWSILRYALRLRGHAYHVFILDHSGMVLFSSDIADTSDLQQLTQKYLDGHIIYSSYEAHDVRSLIGISLTEFPAIRVLDDEKATLPLKKAAPRSQILLFTSRCPDCSLDSLTKASNVLEATKSLTPDSTPPPILLFSSRFSSFSLRQLVHVYRAPHDVYQAVGSIPGLEDLASLTLSTPADVCLITLNSDDLIIGVESFALHQGHLERIAEQSYGTDQ